MLFVKLKLGPRDLYSQQYEAEKINLLINISRKIVYSLLNVAVNKRAVCCQWLQNDFHTLEISDRIFIFTSSSSQRPRQSWDYPTSSLLFLSFSKLETS